VMWKGSDSTVLATLLTKRIRKSLLVFVTTKGTPICYDPVTSARPASQFQCDKPHVQKQPSLTLRPQRGPPASQPTPEPQFSTSVEIPNSPTTGRSPPHAGRNARPITRNAPHLKSRPPDFKSSHHEFNSRASWV
jgi:hypothetical protein